jgi:hypothetical protein
MTDPTQRIAELEQELAAERAARATETSGAWLNAAASRMHFHDAGDAARFLSTDGIDTPADADRRVRELAASRPHLVHRPADSEAAIGQATVDALAKRGLWQDNGTGP